MLDQARQQAAMEQHVLRQAQVKRDREVAEAERDNQRASIAFEGKYGEYSALLQQLGLENKLGAPYGEDWVRQQYDHDKQRFEEQVRVRNAQRGWYAKDSRLREAIVRLSDVIRSHCDSPDGAKRYGVFAAIACVPEDPLIAKAVNVALQGPPHLLLSLELASFF